MATLKKMLHQKDQMILEKEKKVEPLARSPPHSTLTAAVFTQITLQQSLAFSAATSKRLSGWLQAASFPKLEASGTHLGGSHSIKGYFLAGFRHLRVGARQREIPLPCAE